MNFVEAYLSGWKKYFEADGRSGRQEYWTFVIVNFAIGLILGIFSTSLYNLFTIAYFVPSIMVAIRRMHDSDRSGWWILVPVVNIVFLFFPSTEGENRFGASVEGGGSVSVAPSAPEVSPLRKDTHEMVDAQASEMSDIDSE